MCVAESKSAIRCPTLMDAGQPLSKKRQEIRHVNSNPNPTAGHHLDARGLHVGHDRHQFCGHAVQPEVAFLTCCLLHSIETSTKAASAPPETGNTHDRRCRPVSIAFEAPSRRSNIRRMPLSRKYQSSPHPEDKSQTAPRASSF